VQIYLKDRCHCVAVAALEADVVELPPYNWGQNVIDAPSANTGKGQQVLHFGQADYPYQKSPEGVEFVNRYLKNAKALTSDADLLRYASDQVKVKGAYIELGVTTGKTINFIAALNPTQTIYGFDSFMGNPEDYEKDGHKYTKGVFGLKDPNLIPPVLTNVKLIKGSYSEALPYYVEKYLNKQPIAFLHVDTDLYSSTNDALKVLGPYIVPGTIIVFDEFYGYSDYTQFEYKALMEFLEVTGYHVEYIAYNVNFEGVAVRILPKS
jgi:Macrocin-O-methyltransferase (TylF)